CSRITNAIPSPPSVRPGAVDVANDSVPLCLCVRQLCTNMRHTLCNGSALRC
ncbi:MAG: hypothetical protein AVDCRST_MAG68-4419, partial [uncultured Gemmatimonadetes bacterium]